MPGEKQQNFWYFFIDIVGSSDDKLTLTQQLSKVKKVNAIISSFLKEKQDPHFHITYTGDGSLITFNDLNSTVPFELSKSIHDQLHDYNNENKENEIHFRIGIGHGLSTLYENCFENREVPWGRDLIIARRILDNANPDQILLTHSAQEYVKSDIHLNIYSNNVKEVGSIIPKSGPEEKVYSFYEDHSKVEKGFGNNIVVLPSEEAKRKIMVEKIYRRYNVKNLRSPLNRFIAEHENNFIESFNKILEPGQYNGLELDLKETDLLFRFLFEYADNYISATHLLPSAHYNFHSNTLTSFYSYQEDAVKRYRSKNPDKTLYYRFLLMDMNELKRDLIKHRPDNFINWHEFYNIQLIQIDIAEANNIKTRNGLYLNSDTGMGLWEGSYAIQFGPIKHYVRELKEKPGVFTYNTTDYNNTRVFSVYDKDDMFGTYAKCVKFFDDLKNSNNKKVINKHFYDNLLKNSNNELQT